MADFDNLKLIVVDPDMANRISDVDYDREFFRKIHINKIRKSQFQISDAIRLNQPVSLAGPKKVYYTKTLSKKIEDEFYKLHPFLTQKRLVD